MFAREVLDHLSDGCQIIGFDWRYLYVNEVAARHNRQSCEALVGRTVMECHPGVEQTPLFARLRECMTQRRPVRLESEYTFADGTTGWFELRLDPVPQGVCVFSTDISAHRRATERVQAQRLAAEAHLADLIEQAPDGIFISDLDGRYTEVNSAGCRLLGLRREELIGRVIAEFIPPEEVPRLAAVRARLLEGSDQVVEGTMRHKDGHWVPVEVSAKILRDGRWQAFIRDITERKRREEQLRLAEATASGILANSADAIICVDEALRITLFNESAAHIYGYTREDALGLPLEQLIPERFRARHRGLVDGFIAGAETSRRLGSRGRELFGLKKDGTEFPADVAISRVEVDGTRVLTVTVRDTTEQRRREAGQRFLSDASATLSESLDVKQTLGSLSELVARELADLCGVFLIEGGELRFMGCSAREPEKAALCERIQLLGVDRGRPNVLFEAASTLRPLLASPVTPEQLAGLGQTEEHTRALAALGPTGLISVPLLARGRLLGLITLVTTAARGYGEDDLALAVEVGRRAALAVDNAELYAAAQRAMRAREEMLSVVAHDLRNPLQGLQLQASVLRRRADAGDGACARPAERINHAVNRMTRLVQDLLDVSRIEAGKLALERVRTSPSELLAEVDASQRPLAATAGITLEVEAPADLPEVEVDRHRLLQVFENLVGNALKFTPRGGRISVSATVRGAAVELRVSDTGSGIPAEALPHLFERFWQGGTPERGAGLGLPIARGIVEAHGGRIWVESAPGDGTTVRFTVPLAPG